MKHLFLNIQLVLLASATGCQSDGTHLAPVWGPAMSVDEGVSVVTGERVLHGSLSGRSYYRSRSSKIDFIVKECDYPQELTFRMWRDEDVRGGADYVVKGYVYFGYEPDSWLVFSPQSDDIIRELYEELDTYYGPVGGGIVRVTIPPGVRMVSLRKDPASDARYERLAYERLVYERSPSLNGKYFCAVSDIAIDKPSVSKAPVVGPATMMAAPIGATINVDVRAVRLSDGKVVVSATQGNAYGRLPRLTRELAEQLKSGIATRGAAIAITDFVNRGDSAIGAAVVREVVDKLSGALVQTSWFNVKERVSLGKLVDERDLGLAGIVKTPEAKAKLGNVDYLVIGGITITGVSR
jgi:hypothetical protein